MLQPHKAQLAKFRGFGKTGSPIYDPPVEIGCYISRPGLKVVVNPKGQETVANAVVYTQTKVDVNDLIIFEGREYPVILSIHHIGIGLSYYKVVV